MTVQRFETDQERRDAGFTEYELETSELIKAINKHFKAQGSISKLRRPKAGEVPKGSGKCWIWRVQQEDGSTKGRYCKDSHIPEMAKELGIKTTVWVKFSNFTITTFSPFDKSEGALDANGSCNDRL